MIDQVFEAIKKVIDTRYLSNSKFYCKNNKTGFYSLMVESTPSLYHLDSGAHLFARVKLNGKVQYVSFSGTFEKDFDGVGICFAKSPSDGFIRINVDEFMRYLEQEDLRRILNKIYIYSFSFPSFGCCGKYVDCSNAGHCVHDDILYASAACQYKRNLDAGRIFYSSDNK